MSAETMFEPTPHYPVVESLADQFRKFFLDDPIEKALNEGKLLWGDILCTPEEEERVRELREEREREELAARYAKARATFEAARGGLAMAESEALALERAAYDQLMVGCLEEANAEVLVKDKARVARAMAEYEAVLAEEEAERKRYWAEELERKRAKAPAPRAAPFPGRQPTACVPPVASYRDVPAFPAGRRTLMAKNLPRDINVQELRTIFEKYGAIRDIYIPKNMDKSSPYFGTIKGFAKIQFLKADDSAAAFAAQYNLLNIRGKNIALEPAAADR